MSQDGSYRGARHLLHVCTCMKTILWVGRVFLPMEWFSYTFRAFKNSILTSASLLHHFCMLKCIELLSLLLFFFSFWNCSNPKIEENHTFTQLPLCQLDGPHASTALEIGRGFPPCGGEWEKKIKSAWGAANLDSRRHEHELLVATSPQHCQQLASSPG